MTDRHHVFLSYSRNDLDAAVNLRGQLDRHGLAVFRDEESIREGELWLNRLQEAVDACASFIVLVGRDGVGRWIGAETQVALSRYFGPHDDAERLPIFPILLGDTAPDTLPAFLRLFQTTPWNGSDPLPERLLEQIREGITVANESTAFEGCPFVGLNAYRMDQAQLFFGRQKETLDALACFDTRPGSPTVRWLEINGNSGSGKSSLMNAGLLPLVDQGWLWPRTGFEHWRRIGPMMPGEHPVAMLAEQLARSFGVEMADVSSRLEIDERALAEWLRGRKQDKTAFLLAIDQFEELFTFADPDERSRFDRLLAGALEDTDCPLFVISTVRTDFLDRFENLPRLVAVRNRSARPWTLPLIGTDGLREIIAGPARLAGLDVIEVREVMVAEAREEPGALPLVQNALYWLWEHRKDRRLSGQLFTDQGGLAGILSHSADGLLQGLDQQRDRGLELLFRLVKLDPEGRRHTRQRIPLAEAVAAAGGGERGQDLVYRLAGARARDGGQARGPLRLITVTEEADDGTAAGDEGRWVNLIHETLIRSKGTDAKGQPQPYWPTLWRYIEQNRGQAVVRDRVRLLKLEIEDAAAKWQRAEIRRWPEERIQEVLREIARSGVSLDDVVRSDSVRAFLGPTDPQEIEGLLALDEAQDEASGSGRYGDAWRLPLGQQARATLGDRLAMLDDRRRGVGLREDRLPDIAWCRIEGGEVTIEKRTRTVAQFWLARYPVTIVQFQAFLQDCRRDGGWQLAPGFPVDRLLDDPLRHQARHGNQPVDNLNWYDAAAFCHWLGARQSERYGTEFEIRLPMEFEWQLAATGGEPANTFPWGADWNPEQEHWRANTAESGLNRSTAVGFYPLGASKTGVLDMAGTIWEWCCNTYDDPDRTGDSEEYGVPRVLRGGSWGSNQVNARCASRSRNYPNYRFNNFGFRVLCSSPIVEP